MIHGNKGGNIGYSSSKISKIPKKLFTPIQISVPNASDIDNHREKSTPNSPRKKDKNSSIEKDMNLTFTERNTKKNYTQAPKVKFILPPKKKPSSTGNSRTSSPSLDKTKEVKIFNFQRSKSKNINDLNKSLILFEENFDILVNSIQTNKKKKDNNEKRYHKLLNSKSLQLPNENGKFLRKSKTEKINATCNNPILLFNPLFSSLEDEAKALTNSIEIANFYEYTKNCMRIIVQLRENKSKASKPKKVKILNPNNNKKLAIFDLDETLIHGVVNISNYKKSENIISITLPSKKIAKIGVNVRPYWKEAIERISKLYTIVIYTASHKSYADAVLNFLDPENKYFYNRLYRNNCIDCKIDGKDLYVKDLSIFEGFNLKDILIVDNSVMAFAYNLDNGIPILPYYDAEKDFELLFVAYYFECLYPYDDLTLINKQYMKLDYYLKEAIEEIKRENEEEEEDDIIDNVKKKENNNSNNNTNNNIKNNNNVSRRNKAKEKGISTQNIFFLKKQKIGKRVRKRPSKFIQEFQLDLKELRNKFNRDEEF
jgi:Dullard-like phosphatase family protein